MRRKKTKEMAGRRGYAQSALKNRIPILLKEKIKHKLTDLVHINLAN